MTREARRDMLPFLNTMNQLEEVNRLRDLNDPEDRVRQGLKWMQNQGAAVAESLEVATIIINNLPAVLSKMDLLRVKQENQISDPS